MFPEVEFRCVEGETLSQGKEVSKSTDRPTDQPTCMGVHWKDCVIFSRFFFTGLIIMF